MLGSKNPCIIIFVIYFIFIYIVNYGQEIVIEGISYILLVF